MCLNKVSLELSQTNGQPICLSDRPCMNACMHLSVHPSFSSIISSIFLSVFLYFQLSVWFYRLSVYLSVCLMLYIYSLIYLDVCQLICYFNDSSIFLFFNLLIYFKNWLINRLVDWLIDWVNDLLIDWCTYLFVCLYMYSLFVCLLTCLFICFIVYLIICLFVSQGNSFSKIQQPVQTLHEKERSNLVHPLYLGKKSPVKVRLKLLWMNSIPQSKHFYLSILLLKCTWTSLWCFNVCSMIKFQNNLLMVLRSWYWATCCAHWSQCNWFTYTL